MLGVFKKLPLLLVICSILSGCSLSSSKNKDIAYTVENYITDYANVVDDKVEEELNELGKKLEDTTGAQIAVVVVKSLDGNDIRDVGYKTFQKASLGNKDKDNGLLFLVSIDDRESSIEVGRGLEGDITDIESKHLQDECFAPYAKEGNYSEGVRSVYRTVYTIITGEDLGETGYVSKGDKFLSNIKSFFLDTVAGRIMGVVIVVIMFLAIITGNGLLLLEMVARILLFFVPSDGSSSDTFSGGGGRSSGGGSRSSW